MAEHWYTVPGFAQTGAERKALRCAHCLWRIEGTGPRSVDRMSEHTKLVHEIEEDDNPESS